MTESVLILGANGRLGRALVTAFAEAGWKVFAQARRRADQSVAKVHSIATDVSDPERFTVDAPDATVVVHAMNAPYTRWTSDALPQMRLAMEIAGHLDATLMFAGNVYNFGATLPAVLREDTLQMPSTKKGRIRVQTELLLRERAASGLRSIVIRAGDFFGCGSGSWMDQVIAKDLPNGKIVYPGPVHLPHAWAFLPDLARTFVAVASVRHRCASFETFHFPGDALTGQQLAEGLVCAGRRAGLDIPVRAPIISRFPWWALRAGSLAVPMWRELLEMRYLWDQAHSLDGGLLVKLLGQVPRTPPEQAMSQTIASLGFGAASARRGT